MNREEILWKDRFQSLCSELEDIKHTCAAKVYTTAKERVFVRQKRIYVGFDGDCVDVKSTADKMWGGGFYDVYELNEKLSPPDSES